MGKKLWTVFVDDNYHYQDESERYKKGDYKSYGEAIAASKEIVDDFLTTAYKKGMTASELYESYTRFGDDPYVISEREFPRYSSWEYAKERSAEICGET